MQERHSDEGLYFREQEYTAVNFIIPFIKKYVHINPDTNILEVGTNKGGNMSEFLKCGCNVTGVDINEAAVNYATEKFREFVDKGKAEFISSDIYKYQTTKKFDLVFLKDTIEHIEKPEKLISHLKYFLKDSGKMFIAFPPWQMPFGGHQQMMRNRLASKMPYIHLFPAFFYKLIMRLNKEPESVIDDLLYIKKTGLSIESFNKVLKICGFVSDERIYYFINPNYQIKFGLKPRVQSKLVSSIPFFRNFFITTSYYIISMKKPEVPMA